MLNLKVEFDLGPLGESLSKLRRSLDSELERALRTTSGAVRDEAKRSHSYQDRTGRLTRSLATFPTSGRFSAGDLEGGVVATMPYASYVEDGTSRARAYQYLRSAWDMQKAETDQRVADALERALTRAGLR